MHREAANEDKPKVIRKNGEERYKEPARPSPYRFFEFCLVGAMLREFSSIAVSAIVAALLKVS